MADLETAKMSQRGQIIIPKDVREYVGASEDTIFTIMPLDKETIIMRKLDKNRIIQELRNIRGNVKEKMTPKEINREIVESRKH